MLRFVAMDRRCAYAVLVQGYGYAVCATFSTCKNKYVLHPLFTDHMLKKSALVIFLDKVHRLAYRGRCRRDRRNFYFNWVLEDTHCQVLDFARHGCRE